MRSRYKNILLTGGTGQLGQAFRKLSITGKLLAPSHKKLDISDRRSVQKFFRSYSIDAVVHCAACARISVCEKDPGLAIQTNIIGTSNLVSEVLEKEQKTKRKIRFVHISTDGVYPGTMGRYKETDPVSPYNNYGWTKLGAETAVRLLSDHCIIRTNFFDPGYIRFETSAMDLYTSKMEIDELARSISFLLQGRFVGVVNVGSERKSDFERYRAFKKDLKSCKRRDILKEVPFVIAADSSLNTSLWQRLQKKK